MVLNLDHYCSWLFAPVGYRNYRYYLLFVLYFCAATIFVASVCLPPYFELVTVAHAGLLFPPPPALAGRTVPESELAVEWVAAVAATPSLVTIIFRHSFIFGPYTEQLTESFSRHQRLTALLPQQESVVAATAPSSYLPMDLQLTWRGPAYLAKVLRSVRRAFLPAFALALAFVFSLSA